MPCAEDAARIDPPPSAGDLFLTRWQALPPIEQRLVAMAIDAISVGTFSCFQEWQRFVDTATDLLVLVETGALTLDELHAMALDAASGLAD